MVKDSSNVLDVVVPIYNLSGYLADSLTSLAKQDTDDYRVILVDDASTDDTVAIAEKFLEKYSNFQLIQLPQHMGASAARNAGIDAALGIGIAFVDGDDRVETDYVRLLTQGLVENNADIAAVGYTWHSPVGFGSFNRIRPAEWTPITKQRMLQEVQTHGSTVGGYIWNKAFRRELLNQHQLRFDTRLQIAEDYLFTTEAAAAGEHFVYYDRVLYHKVNRPGSTIHSRTYKMRSQEAEVFAQMAEIARNSQA
ncbi:glycosyltransferase family 2 protein [Lactobacillus sp. CC-MHH1034]|uniref:glycosyltransferase family 2 protein n=1 Tax=Agrilactobacillus fermenti TaxID=2586909 RepID=UPI001E5A3172|nr:glycosyltransferase family 2 protein [Agrilactobacillus fermenti]MCD2257283.1 glycosyltransferase family 2 protein [Agrilactobacillus fermenti]